LEEGNPVTGVSTVIDDDNLEETTLVSCRVLKLFALITDESSFLDCNIQKMTEKSKVGND
jgi:hypothetical protein